MKVEELFELRKIPFTKGQKKRISKAYDFAKEAHQGQKRASGEDYFVHCVETATTLVKMGLGSITVSAALLHDTYEDTDVSLEEIEKEFGKDIAFIVKGVSKLSKVQLKGSEEEYYLNNLQKMFLAMAADIRVVLIKLADRLHNMRTLSAKPLEKQQRIAKETMEVFVPIANRLGIGEIKGQLEDICFKYLDPRNYKYVLKLEKEVYPIRKKYVNEVIKKLKKKFKEEGIKIVDIHGRAKHYFSLHQKLQKYDNDIERVYDLAGVRIIVPKVADCYEILGIVHKNYKPLIGRIKDYISLPKPNGYKSIHTTIFGPKGKIIEVQIRTEKMHDEAEYGIAAHWIYDQTKGGDWKRYIFGQEHISKVPNKEIEWVRQLKEWHNQTGGVSDEFWSSLKIDFFKDYIFVFTPSGDVIELPEGATPIDFAYKVHTEIGNRTSGVKINGKMSVLDTALSNGDLVEVITTKNFKLPNRDWLEFVQTAGAKEKIKNILRKNGVKVV
jgi:GTP pyrophosphokinase